MPAEEPIGCDFGTCDLIKTPLCPATVPSDDGDFGHRSGEVKEICGSEEFAAAKINFCLPVSQDFDSFIFC